MKVWEVFDVLSEICNSFPAHNCVIDIDKEDLESVQCVGVRDSFLVCDSVADIDNPRREHRVQRESISWGGTI
jgi:hypothetical protein